MNCLEAKSVFWVISLRQCSQLRCEIRGGGHFDKQLGSTTPRRYLICHLSGLATAQPCWAEVTGLLHRARMAAMQPHAEDSPGA